MTTLRQLRYLAALADHGHFGRAASACAVTQPALSQQIADLEAELGVSLVDRTPRGSALTEAGQAIVTRARAILAEVHDLGHVARPGAALTGPVTLGVIPTIAPYALPHILPAVQSAHPAVDLRVREAVSATLIAELRSGALDAILLALPVEDRDMTALPLFDDPFVLVTATGDARSSPVDVATLDREGLLLLDEGHCLRNQALSICGIADPGLRSRLGATSLATLVQLVAGGLGCTLVPAMALETLVRHDPRVRAIPFAAPAPVRSIGLVYRASASRHAAFAALGATIAGACLPLIEIALAAAAPFATKRRS